MPLHRSDKDRITVVVDTSELQRLAGYEAACVVVEEMSLFDLGEVPFFVLGKVV